MATYNKFENFMTDYANKVHDLLGTAGSDADTLSVYLSNATPSVSADAIKTDVAEITTGNGYTGPVSTQNVGTETTGTLTVVGTDITITASGGSIAAFRYVILFNDTPSSPLDPLIGWWDYGSSVTLLDTQQFTINFGSSLFTIA